VDQSLRRNGNVRMAERSRARLIAEIAVAGAGAALVILALAANQTWLDRHVLPSFVFPAAPMVRDS